MSLGQENEVLNDTKDTVNKLWQMHCKLDDDVQFKLNDGSAIDAIRELRTEVLGVSRQQRRALEEAVRSLNESKADRRELFIVQKKLASNGGRFAHVDFHFHYVPVDALNPHPTVSSRAAFRRAVDHAAKRTRR